MSAHPRRCAGCQGSGWMPGPVIVETIGGHPHRYTTVKPCDHDWHRDDTGYDPYFDEPIAFDDPIAQAAFARGYAQGVAELDAMRHTAPAPARKDGAA